MPLTSTPARLTLLALLSATTIYCFYKSRRLKKISLNPNPNKPKLFFISQTGTSKTLAHRLHNLLASNNLHFDLIDPQNYEPEDLFKEKLVIIIASTWEDGKPPQNAKFFANWLAESADDFRVGSLMLSECKFAVFGVGSRAYGETFNAVAKDFSRRLRDLGAKEVVGVGEGDVDGGELDGVFEEWSGRLARVLKGESVENGEVCGNGVVVIDESDDDEDDGGVESDIIDLEDIAGKGPSRRSLVVAQSNGKLNGENGKLNGQKEMVTPVIRASLEKQV
jgi:tRNA wybutosine-synthesizing protein 1